MARRKKLTKDQFKTLVEDGIRSSAGYSGGELQRRRERALEYYFGYPNGHEVAGRSSVTSTDVFDTIESMLPTLMKPFIASGEVVRFDPTGPEDEKQAEQATEYVNHIFLKKNNGFEILHEVFKDALLSGIGVLKTFYDDSVETQTETYEGLSEEQLIMLLSDPEVEAVEHEVDGADSGSSDINAPALTHTVKVKRKTDVGKVVVETVAPEDFYIDRRARTIEEANFLASRIRVTASDLKEMGFSSKVIENIPSHDEEDLTIDRQLRESLDDSDFGNNSTGDSTTDPSRREMYLYECYIKCDLDGDGVTEMVRVLAAGSGSTEILEFDEVDDHPFSTLVPIPMPHRFFGMSISDQLFEVQDIKTSLLRSLLDNVYLANNQRHEVVEGMVNMKDMLNSRPGGVVRVKQPGMVNQLANQPIIGPALQALEYADSMKEVRTGVAKHVQGIDTEALHETATGAQLMLGMAQQRIEMVARVFAEGGIKDLFKKILRLVVQNQQKEQIIRLRNEWVPMDPRSWKTSYDLTVSVGLGNGTQSEQMAAMSGILATQEKIAAQMGVGNGSLVTRSNIYNALKKQAEAAGLKDPTAYFTPPQGEDPKPGPSAQDTFMEGQIEIERGKLELENKKAITRAEQDQEELDAKIALERERMAASMEETAAKIAADTEKASTELQVKAALAREKSEYEMHRDGMDRERVVVTE